MEEPLKCPRCESTNTKFCYFNNYSKSQPRHHCRVCKRYWIAGGTLRNVPVGGRIKKKRRSRKSPKNKKKPVQKAKSVKLKPSAANHGIENSDGHLEQKVDALVVVVKKHESSGEKSQGSDRKDVLKIPHSSSFRNGLNEVNVLKGGILSGVVDCSTDQALFDHEMFSFELPETCDLMKLQSNEALDKQQVHLMPDTLSNLELEMSWELDDPGTLDVSDYVNIDIHEIIQSWDL